MKLSDAREAYYNYSGQLSSVSRQLCFAGIAVVWLLKGEGNLPGGLWLPLVFFVVSLALDLLHYLLASIVWSNVARVYEKRLGVDDDAKFECKKYVNWPALFCFYPKAVCCVAAYAALIAWMLPRL